MLITELPNLLSEINFNLVFRMRYVAAFLLAVLGGKGDPSVADIEKILSSVGVESDQETIKRIIKQLGGKSINDVIAEGL